MDGTAAPPGASALSSPAFRKYLCGNLVAYIGFRMQRDGLGPLIMLCIILLVLATQRQIRTLAEV